MPFGGICGSLFCLVIETQLKCIIPVNRFGSDLGNHAWSHLQYRTRDVFPFFVKETGHADFSSY
jgi:hypothetical protein